MKLFCCFTPAHEVLFREVFQPSIPGEFAVVPTRLEIEGAGDFLSPEFLRCIGQKLDLILASVRENWGEIIVWSDVDIQFSNLSPVILRTELGENDVVFQREAKSMNDVNTGFLVCCCGEKTLRFFEQVKAGLQENPHLNEQWVVNDLLREKAVDITWAYLPFRYYARTHGWPPPRDWVIYHANWTKGQGGVEQKLLQFRELDWIRRYGWPVFFLVSLKYAPRRIWRLVSSVFR